jgi:prophage regulatory protein
LARIEEVADMLGVSRSTLYNLLSAGSFCAPIRIGPRTVRFLRSEVIAWIEERADARKLASAE